MYEGTFEVVGGGGTGVRGDSPVVAADGGA
jgi:hypothetical protein